MAKVCYFTGRKTVSGNNRSHAMKAVVRVPQSQRAELAIRLHRETRGNGAKHGRTVFLRGAIVKGRAPHAQCDVARS